MGRSHLPRTPEKLWEEFGDVWCEMGTSHRVTAIVGVASIEQALGTLLSQTFIKGSTSEQIIDPNKGFLGPLMNRASLTYCLGLISKGAYTNINLLGQIRNNFAHSHIGIAFTDEAISDLCKKLQNPIPELPTDFEWPEGLRLPDNYKELMQRFDTDMHFRFVSVVTTLLGQLIRTAENTRHLPRDKWTL